MARVLLAYSNFPRFVRIDRDLLAERHEVEEYGQPGVVPRPLDVVRKVRRADVLVVWFASWHALVPLLVARFLRTPSLLIVGGFDTASMPEIGYGFQQGGIRRRLARASMRVRIPMAAPVESLNVAVAAGVLLFEAARQRRSARPRE